MDTILIKLNQTEKAEALIRFLKSIDYISSVESVDAYQEGKNLLRNITKNAKAGGLSSMTLEDINAEIKGYRSGK